MGLCGERTSRSRCSCCCCFSRCHKLSIFLFTVLLLLLSPTHVTGQQQQQQQPDKLPQLDNVEVENISLTTSAIDTGWWKSLPCQTDGRHTTNGLTDSKYDEDGAFARQLGESRAEDTAKTVTLPMGSEILPGAKTPPNKTQTRTGSNEFKSHLPFAKHDLTPDYFEDTFFGNNSNLFINNEKRPKRSLYYGLKVGVLPSNFRYKSLDHQSAGNQRPRQRQMNRRTERRDRRFQDEGTDRVTHWTNNKEEGAYQSTKGADEEATGEPHTPELTAEESASAPIFVTIVQRHKEADYFIDNHHSYHPPPPPPPPPVYHPEPHYHPHPPLKYHPTPEYYPPPPPPPPPLDYYHYEKESKYYHASDYHEPSYHKPKFVHDLKYVEEHEHYPPPPPPLPLPKHEKGHHYAPPVYHAKSYHETKVQHDYVPPPPPPPKVYHEPVIVHKGHHHKKDYYIPEPEYHHPAPTTYEYSVKIYDRKDDFEPEYYDLPKAYHPGYEQPIKEVKHEYKKGSRSFEHSISKLPPVHIVADNLYDPPPPHGFIKAKYETPASYSPPHHHRYNKDHPLPKTSYHTTHYKDSVPVPPPLPPPPELTEDSYEVPLPAPLPSLEDVDPLIFDPILPYNEYFEDASRIAVGDEFPSSDLPNTPLPREYPFLFDLDPKKHYSSQIPNVHTSITNTPKLTFTYYPPTFPAEEEAEEEEEDSLQQGLTTASMYSNPKLHTSVSTGVPVTLSSTAQSSPTLTTASESVPPKPRVTEPSTGTQQPLTTVVSVLNFPETDTSTPSSAMTTMTSIVTTNNILTEKTTDSVIELSSNVTDETDLPKPVTELTTLESLPREFTTQDMTDFQSTINADISTTTNLQDLDITVSNEGLLADSLDIETSETTTIPSIPTTNNVLNGTDRSEQVTRPTSLEDLQKIRVTEQTLINGKQLQKAPDLLQLFFSTRPPALKFSLPLPSEISSKDRNTLRSFFFPESPQSTPKKSILAEEINDGTVRRGSHGKTMINTENQGQLSNLRLKFNPSPGKELSSNSATQDFQPIPAPLQLVTNKTSISFPETNGTEFGIDAGLLEPSDANQTQDMYSSNQTSPILNMYDTRPMSGSKLVQGNMYYSAPTQAANMYGSYTQGEMYGLNMYAYKQKPPKRKRNKIKFPLWNLFWRRSNTDSYNIDGGGNLPVHFQL